MIRGLIERDASGWTHVCSVGAAWPERRSASSWGSPGAPAEFAALIAGETNKWAKVVRFAGAKAD